MKGPDTKTGDEQLAVLVLRAALGAQVIQHDDGSRPGMFDLLITHPGGAQAAAEVTSTRNRKALGLEAAVTTIGYIPRPELAKRWAIVVNPGAALQELVRAAPPLLAQLEEVGVEQRPPELESLGVARCWSLPPTEMYPSGFFLTARPTWDRGGTGNDAVRACDELLATTPDVPTKLLASGKCERHAVVVVTADWVGPFGSIAEGALPTMAPTLPEGVDCLWMVTLKWPPIRAIYWLGDGVWRDLVLAEEELAALGE